ncbi:hypothetical protein C8F01DRAFT_40729 [Mycena amicta]|nr:hypothetical protein C8F01DRAFT_40729 [Mycena amicta]
MHRSLSRWRRSRGLELALLLLIVEPAASRDPTRPPIPSAASPFPSPPARTRTRIRTRTRERRHPSPLLPSHPPPSCPQLEVQVQARCVRARATSPDHNETRAHREKEKYWPDLADPALEHPMIPRVLKIFEVYKRRAKETGQQQPLIKSASYLSVAEVLACAEIGVHHSTIPAGLLEKLRTLPATVASDPSVAHILPGIAKPTDMAHVYSAPAVDRAPVPRLAHRLTTDPLTPGFTGKWDGDVPYAQEVDYLADGGKKLDEAIERDVESKGRLVQALTGFQNHELVIREIIDKEMKVQGFAK